DNTLDARQTRARATYFGCSSMTDAQYEQRQCVTAEGDLVDLDGETRSCTCARNPFVATLHGAPSIQGLGHLLQQLLSNSDLRTAFEDRAADPSGLDAEQAARLPQLAAE